MLRLTLRFSVLTAAMSLTACVAPPPDVVNADISIGDQCFYTLEQRPDDCFEHAPCMWSDANLQVTQDDSGVFHVEADSGGGEVRSKGANRTAHASATSPEQLARQLPELLATLHEAPPLVSQACVSINPDQSMRVGDVVAIHDTLMAQHVRRVGLVAALAEEE